MDEIEFFNHMSPAQIAEERARLAAHRQRLDEFNNGVMVNGVRVYPKEFPVMTQYRADSTQPAIREVVHTDQTGRKITEFRGESMKSWMAPFMTPPYVQLGIFNGGDPAEFRQRMQRKIAAYDAALAGGRK